ncbi:NAD(P)-binding protein [Pluteus cervinus]|uniref:NAD(P)-binding protein n=1 Tax=Pluteus cervinus TaxID=181527 RepID=A0ACD3AFL1_9AGAR|nr:NAD(P)-binding protein [Pluteus cervinus]
MSSQTPTSGYKSFAIAGVGLIGRPILDALLARNVPVVVLTRSPKEDILPAGGKFATVDYNDVPGIAKVLKENHVDVLISTVAQEALGQEQISLADASHEAGVKLFVPSEFGIPTVGRTQGIFGYKKNLTEHLQKLGIPSFRIFTGWFIEGALDLAGYENNKKVNIIGKGTAPISFTAMSDIAGFVAHVLTTQPREKVENKIARLEGDRASLVELAGYLKTDIEYVDEITGPHGPNTTFLQTFLDTGAGSTGWDPVTNSEGPEKAGSGNALWEGHQWKRIVDVVQV